MSQCGLEGQQTLTGFIPSTTNSWLQGTIPHMTELSWASLRFWCVFCDKKESFQQVVYLFHFTFWCQASVMTEVICSVPAEWAPRWLLDLCHSDIGCGKRDQQSLWSTVQRGNVRTDWGKVCRALQGGRVPKEPQSSASEMWIVVCVRGCCPGSLNLLWLSGVCGRLPQPGAVDSRPASPPPALANALSKHLCLCWCSSPAPEMFSLLSEHLAQTLAHLPCPVCKLWEFGCAENRKKVILSKVLITNRRSKVVARDSGLLLPLLSLLFYCKKTLQQTKNPKPNAYAEGISLVFVSHTWGCFQCSCKFGWLFMLVFASPSSSSSCWALAPEVPAQHGSKQHYGSGDRKTSFVCRAGCFASGWLMQMFQWFRKRRYLVMEACCAGSEVQQFRCCCW